MRLIDTHTHLYLDYFDSDRAETVRRAIETGVDTLLLPNIDADSIKPLMKMKDDFPEICHSMMGLHPSSVNKDYERELTFIHGELMKGGHVAVGEIGIDLYWDKTYLEQQEHALEIQLDWAHEFGLPFVIHMRESYHEIIMVINSKPRAGLEGVFHCFTGSLEQAREITGMGFHLGIGGVLTYKNSGLPFVLEQIDPQWVILETDSPYLTPMPHRGKRNESSYLTLLLPILAQLWSTTEEDVAEITTENAKRLFKIN